MVDRSCRTVLSVAAGKARDGRPRLGWKRDQTMNEWHRSADDDVEQLLLNARLRDELEPFFDESIRILSSRRLPTPRENEFLASMLAWERAPVLPISQWFDPELVLAHPESLDDQSLRAELAHVIRRLFEKRIVLEYTDHLSDRELYCLIYRDILPSPEKRIDLPGNYLHWHCLDDHADPELWLRYYASDDERQRWEEETGETAPPAEVPPYRRRLPRRPRGN